MLKNPAVRFTVLGLALLGSATVFYLISPLFMDDGTLGYPTLAYMPTQTSIPPTETPAPVATDAANAPPLALDVASSQLLLQGEFHAVVHDGSGKASVYQTEDGRRVLQLEDFQVVNGPDLYVYLSTEENIPNTSGVALPGEFYDLGTLRAVTGLQAYAIPDDIQLDHYRSVVIWCLTFEVPFSAAPIQAP